jgi:hypothetical protein
MAPIPEHVHGRMLPSDLKEEELSRASTMLLNLREMSSYLMEPPYHEVRMGKGQFLIEMNDAFVLPGGEIGSFIQSADKLGLFPKYWSYFPLGRGFWEKTFHITIENEKYDSSSQMVRVSRNINNVRYAMEWIEEGVINDTTENTKVVIAALAVLPDALWPLVVKRGLVVGNIESTAIEGEWKINSDSFLVIPDIRIASERSHFKAFHWSTIEDFMKHAPLDEGTDFVFLHPVGVFAYTGPTE